MRGWALKNWCFRTVVLEKTLRSSLDCKEIKPVNPKENQSWIFIGRTDAEAPVLWLPDAKSWLTGKDPDAGKDWRQEEKGTTEDEMAGWHHWLNGREFKQSLGDGEGHGRLVRCNPWGCKESETTERLNNNYYWVPMVNFLLLREKRFLHVCLFPSWSCSSYLLIGPGPRSILNKRLMLLHWQPKIKPWQTGCVRKITV